LDQRGKREEVTVYPAKGGGRKGENRCVGQKKKKKRGKLPLEKNRKGVYRESKVYRSRRGGGKERERASFTSHGKRGENKEKKEETKQPTVGRKKRKRDINFRSYKKEQCLEGKKGGNGLPTLKKGESTSNLEGKSIDRGRKKKKKGTRSFYPETQKKGGRP